MSKDFENDQIDIGQELRRLRSEAPDGLVSRVVSHLESERARPRFAQRATRRTALVFAMTVALVSTAGAFGAVTPVASGIEGAVSAVVHIGSTSHPARTSNQGSHGLVKPHQPPTTNGGPSDDQYNPGCQVGWRGRYVTCRP